MQSHRSTCWDGEPIQTNCPRERATITTQKVHYIIVHQCPEMVACPQPRFFRNARNIRRYTAIVQHLLPHHSSTYLLSSKQRELLLDLSKFQPSPALPHPFQSHCEKLKHHNFHLKREIINKILLILLKIKFMPCLTIKIN